MQGNAALCNSQKAIEAHPGWRSRSINAAVTTNMNRSLISIALLQLSSCTGLITHRCFGPARKLAM
jgi:hypothetical protein